MKIFRFSIFCLLSTIALSFAVSAQETQTRVVDEVVAQVNDNVITLSRVKREKKEAVDTFVQQGKSRPEAQKLVDEREGELIAQLINEELLMQKAKENGLDTQIEAGLNQRFLEIMKQYNLKTVEALYAEMEKSGVDPKELKDTWRKQATRDRVIQQEVQAKVYWKFSGAELKAYYEKHKDKFTKPELISISEVFLGFAGRDEAKVRDKAKSVYAQLKTGANFETIAKENDAGVVTQGAGKAEKLRVNDLPEKLVATLKDVKPGDIAQPFEAEQLGMVILRVDAREAPSSESVFDENAVRSAMAAEEIPAEQKKFLSRLRDDSYIKISESYRPIVAPILFADERKEKPGN